MKHFTDWLLLILLGALSGCANPAESEGPLRLKATMTSPVDIVVEWSGSEGNPAGYVLEYTNDPEKEEFVPLGHFPAHVRRFEHPQLIPETKFHYRVRAYYGHASEPVEVSLPETLTDEAYAARYAQPEDYSWGQPIILPDIHPVEKVSLKNPATRPKAAPANLRAQLMSDLTVSGFRLTWTDHAADEEGALLEGKLQGSSEYVVCAMVEPDINAFGWAFEPPARKGSFRIRPIYYSPPSSVVVKQTGKNPKLGPE